MMRKNLRAAAAAALLISALGACGSQKDSAAEQGGAGGMADMPGMGAASGASMAGMVMADGDGLSKTREGYTLSAVKTPTVAGKAGKLSFQIKGPSGSVHKEYVLSQTKLLHLYLVRKDLTYYQHLHPALNTATGAWSLPVTLAKPGPYHLMVEFSALGPNEEDVDARKLGTDFTVAGRYTPTPFVAAPGPWSVDGYELAVEGQPKVGAGELKLRITRDGKEVTDLQSYLESFAHVTGFRKGDLKGVHAHPAERPTAADPEGGPQLTLLPMFAAAGSYRMFVEFQTAGTLHMVPIDLTVT